MSLWIDLTDFLQWRGNLTGIQRIQYNLSKKYIESGEDVRFFVYTEQSRKFTEVEFNPDEVVKSGIVAPDDLRAPSSFHKRITSRLTRVLRRKATNTPPEDVVSPFEQDDIVFVMGGIWVGNFINDLILCKERHHLKFIHFAFDMIPTLFPGYVVDWLPEAFTNYQKIVFTHADGIVAISKSTAEDVRIFMKQHQISNTPRITVLRGSLEFGAAWMEVAMPNLDREEFILSVSTIEGRKNHTALFYVLKEAKRRQITLPKIVIVGRNGWLTDDIRYIMEHDSDAAQGIMILNGVSDAQLAWLYQNCRFTIFPSFYEGWGMPIAESLAKGKLCVASNTSSMTEIAGPLVDYFSPYDTGDILRCVEKYLDNETLAKKESDIATNYRPTSWDDMFIAVSDFVRQ